jgi:hypothetical protein
VRFKVTDDATSYINAGPGYAYDGSVSLTETWDVNKSFTVNGLSLAPNKTYYIFLFPGESYQFMKFCYSNELKDLSTLTAEVAQTYSLTISAGSGSSITVNRTSSSVGATGAISNGATLYYGDKLTISFSASTGYNLGTHTVNGSTFTSGGSHTVSGNVSVVSTASVKSFTLSTTTGTGTTLTVKRTSSPKAGASTGNLSHGATIYYSDVLQITFGANTGYNLTTHTVNSSAFTSGSSHTVTGNVSVVSGGTIKTYKITISNGTGARIAIQGSYTSTSDGIYVNHGTVLSVSFSYMDGYEKVSQSHNNGSYIITSATTFSATARVKSFTLSTSAGANSTITVNRTSSPKQGASTGDLSNGATIYHSDVLKVTFAASTGYGIDTHTVNGSTFTSGDSHTVTAAVSVVATAKALGLVYIDNGTEFEAYQIYIDNGTGWDLYAPYIDNGTDWDLCG